MTDDTDDTDETTDTDRMDRANRIREMREGRRGPATNGEAGHDAATDEDTDAEPSVDAVEATDHDFEFDDGATEAVDEAESNGTADGTDHGATTTNGTDTEATDRSPEVRAQAVLEEAGVTQSVPEARTGAAGTAGQLGGGQRFAIPDQATTVDETGEGAVGEDAEASVAAARAAAAAGKSAYSGEQTRVLEFELGAERFCLDIDYIEEIVELENMTRVPNSPSYVEGVVDLRGQVTAIINPKDALSVGEEGRGDLIIVFDSAEFEEQGHLGWVVDEVRQVTPVADEDVNESPDEEAEHINGVINRDEEEEFIVWTSPDLAMNSS